MAENSGSLVDFETETGNVARGCNFPRVFVDEREVGITFMVAWDTGNVQRVGERESLGVYTGAAYDKYRPAGGFGGSNSLGEAHIFVDNK